MGISPAKSRYNAITFRYRIFPSFYTECTLREGPALPVKGRIL